MTGSVFSPKDRESLIGHLDGLDRESLVLKPRQRLALEEEKRINQRHFLLLVILLNNLKLVFWRKSKQLARNSILKKDATETDFEILQVGKIVKSLMQNNHLKDQL